MDQLFHEYLKERMITEDSLHSMADCFIKIRDRINSLSEVVFLNLLRGSLIPTIITQNIIEKDSMIINIPASCDEVDNQTFLEILNIYLSKDDIRNRDIIWIDEAYSGRMGANISILLLDLLKTLKAKSFSIFFIADSYGKFIKNEYSKILDTLHNDFSGFLSMITLPVESLHWMDNIELSGMNWGRRYSCIPKDIIMHLRSHSYNILRKDIDTKDYLLQYKKARSILKGIEVLSLEEYYYDPHTLWCKNSSAYKKKYELIDSDPTVLIQFSAEKRNQYINDIINIIRKKGNI